ncbi:PAS domain S-box protein [Paenibacillus sp. GSMTC-2017]|uniref:PAS domain S-box protein n=1 Tax=Paenibacillus sp. GSMTC-2017 TaxID=2794350 RepID=UPI0018D75464|nr:PAS domain S-box protein [Paenibacillus sp. GSMTC-2017]MBH5317365.1 PAS domain S-box protein [Paenibacillus sp. GSMTC-2017]
MDTNKVWEENYSRQESPVQFFPDAVLVLSENKIVFANRAAMKMVESEDIGEIVGQPISRLFHFDVMQQFSEMIDVFLEDEKFSDYLCCKLPKKDGHVIDVEVRIIRILYRGNPTIQLVIREISNWSRMRDTINEKDSLYKTLVESVVAGVFVEQEKYIIYANPFLENMFGYLPNEMIGLHLYDLVDKEMIEEIEKNNNFSSDAVGGQYPFQIRGWKKDGSTIYLEGNSSLIIFNGASALLGTVQNVTFKYEQEQLLRSNAKLYQRMIMCIPEPIIISHHEEILYLNQYAMDMFEVTDANCLIGKPFFECIVESDREIIAADMYRTISEDEPSAFREANINLHCGKRISVEISNIRIDNYMGKSVVLSVIRDLTERKRTEERVIRSEKLSVIGQLAAGVAHEIRNPLTSLKGFTQLLRSKYSDHIHYFNIMETELDRINLIVNEFMTLAKPHLAPFQEGSLESILQSVISILDTQAILLNVEIEYEQDELLPPIYCNENQLKQVFLNIIKNALEAMPDGGKVTITTRLQKTNHGNVIHINIQDQGQGIPEELIHRIGEPFVTTKEKGTGLGLMISNQIIEAHNGSLYIDSKRNQGTSVEISLPLIALY